MSSHPLIPMRVNLSSSSRRSLRFLTLLSLLVIGFVARSQAAETPAASARPSYTDEQKRLLAALDAELVRFDAMLAKDTDAAHAASVKTLVDGFKARRDAMNQAAFDQGKYDELRFDINVEYQRLALWLAPPISA
jgi:hypothetical protein